MKSRRARFLVFAIVLVGIFALFLRTQLPDPDVIPFWATEEIDVGDCESQNLPNGVPASAGADAFALCVWNKSPFVITGMTVEVNYRPVRSPVSRYVTVDVSTHIPPGAERLVTTSIVGYSYEEWTSSPDRYRDRPRNWNSQFVTGTQSPSWTIALPIVRGHIPDGFLGQNYLLALRGPRKNPS